MAWKELEGGKEGGERYNYISIEIRSYQKQDFTNFKSQEQ